jgi:hypothetical protein
VSAHESERLSALLDDALSPAERTEVEAHLAVCPQCRAQLAAFEAVDDAAGGLPLEVPPGYFDDFASRVRQRIEASAAAVPAQRSRRLPTWAFAAAAALLLAVITPLTLHERSSRGGVASAPSAAPPAVAPPAAAQPRQAPPPAVAAKAGEPRSTPASPAAPLAAKQQAPARVRPQAPNAVAPAEVRAPASGAAPLAETVTVDAAAANTPAEPAAAPPAAPPADAFEAAVQRGGSAGAVQMRSATAQRDAAARERRVASAPRLDDDFDALARLRPSSVAGWRAQRERWRAFAAAHPDSPRADEARVRAILAGLELVRLGGGAQDEAIFRADASAYLARDDAAQKARVEALLAGAATR